MIACGRTATAHAIPIGGAMRSEGLRDYFYISVRKTERMASTLPASTLKRLTQLNFNAGPVGAGVALSESQRDGVVAAVAEVESAIRKQHRVRQVLDDDLRVGHWVDAAGMSMAYGIPVGFGSDAEHAAVFAGANGNSYVLLSGSAEYLLDRGVATTDVGQGMSFPAAIGNLLGAAGEERDGVAEEIRRSPWIDVGYPIHNLVAELSYGGLHPLTFLARVTHLSLSERDEPPERYVVGTPLFVALDTPE
jgi:hypothetical protein